MDAQQAQQVVDRLVGWDSPRIEDAGYGDYIVTAIDPISHQRKTYDPTTGYFG